MRKQEPADRETTYREVKQFLRAKYGVECLGKLGFENAYALAVRKDKARALGGIHGLAELANHAPQLTIAGDLQFFRLPEWKRVQHMYGLKFKQQILMDQTFMYKAVKDGAVDVVSVYTSDGRILADDLIVLDDPRQAFPPYDAILLLSPQAQTTPGLRAALLPLLGTISTEAMRKANGLVDIHHVLPRKAGRELLGSVLTTFRP
jgi:osmoprotectant transport system permease protein